MTTRQDAINHVGDLYGRYRKTEGAKSYTEGHGIAIGSGWERSFPGITLPVRISRSDVFETLNSNDSQRFRNTYVKAMAWGYGDAGYGPYRAKVIETNFCGSDQEREIGQFLQKLQDAARAGWKNGYEYLANNSISDLGPAFATKLLYFCSRKNDRAPILDSVISKWMWRFGVANDTDYVNSTRFNIEQYELYVKFIDDVLQYLQVKNPDDENLRDRGFIEYLMFIDQIHFQSTIALPSWIK
jgi:hypothetical protein